MNSGADRTLRQTTDFYAVELEGAQLLYRPTARQALHLDPVSAVIWQMCDGSRTAEALVEEIAAFYPDQQRETVAHDVHEALETLQAQGLIVPAEARE